jgi:hypothetical protein
VLNVYGFESGATPFTTAFVPGVWFDTGTVQAESL